MILAIDVYYRSDDSAQIAAIGIEQWNSPTSCLQACTWLDKVEPYVSGEFWRRELPCLMAMLALLKKPELIIVDSYVWLSDDFKPGLGAHLYQALGETVPVVGVAKTQFQGPHRQVCEVYRSGSEQPLYVSAAGIPLLQVAESVFQMSGQYRLPDALRWVDQLSKQKGGLCP